MIGFVKKTYIIIAFLVVMSAAKAQQITLDSCFHALKLNHPAWQMEMLQKQQYEYIMRAIKTGRLPDINLTGQATYQSDVVEIDAELPIPNADFPSAPRDQYKIYGEITQPIYNGGITNAKINMQAAGAQADIHNLHAQQDDIQLHLVSLYSNIRATQQHDSILNKMLLLLDKQLKVLNNAFKNGIVTSIEPDILQAEIIKMDRQKDANHIRSRQAIEQLAVVTGLSLTSEVKLAPLPASNRINNTGNEHDALLALKAQQQSLEARIDLNNSLKRPKLYAFSQVGYGNPGLNMLSSGFDSYYIVGAKLKWNIWDWNEKEYNNQALGMQRQLTGKQYENVEKAITTEILQEKQKILELESDMAHTSQLLEVRQSIITRGADQLEKGQINATDYITYVNALLQVQMEYETQAIILAAAQKRLEILHGEE